MQVLIFTSKEPDYLQDAVLVGFKRFLPQGQVYEYPRKSWIYVKDNPWDISRMRRKPFTFYKICKQNSLVPDNIIEFLSKEKIDYIIFSSIHRQVDLLQRYWNYLKNRRLIFIDGEDHPAIFPYLGKYWRDLSFFSLPKIHKKYLYFKRELQPQTIKYRYYRLLPETFISSVRLKNVYPISFAFPEEKITEKAHPKEKLFPEHIVDEEVAQKLGRESSYVFDNEKEYFFDLQKSKFGITTKRAGWDSMRHYEIAANDAVICFRDLYKKPDLCAPHGLVDMVNCIGYKSYEDLISKINSLTTDKYEELRDKGKAWVREHTTKHLAEYILNTAKKFYK